MDSLSIGNDFSSRTSNQQWDVDNDEPADSGDEKLRHPRLFHGADVNRNHSEEREVARR
jgi:hypothetical protein